MNDQKKVILIQNDVQNHDRFPGLGREMVDTKPVAENAVRSSRGSQTAEQDYLQEYGLSD